MITPVCCLSPARWRQTVLYGYSLETRQTWTWVVACILGLLLQWALVEPVALLSCAVMRFTLAAAQRGVHAATEAEFKARALANAQRPWVFAQLPSASKQMALVGPVEVRPAAKV